MDQIFFSFQGICYFRIQWVIGEIQVQKIEVIKQIIRGMSRNTIPRYIDNTEITTPEELPVHDSQRIPTDVFCTVATAIFALAMFISAIVSLDMNKLQTMTYPTDSMARHCTLDNENYDFLYFPTLSDISRRVCVSECPKGNEEELSCWPTDDIGCRKQTNSQFEVDIYPTTSSETSLGLFCLPEDETVRDQLLIDSGLQYKMAFVKAFHAIWISALIAAAISVLFVVLMLFIPAIVFYANIALGGLFFLAFGALLLAVVLTQTEAISAVSLILIIFSFFIGLLILSSLCLNRHELAIAIMTLRHAVAQIKSTPSLLGVIPVFILLTAGLILLCGYQQLAYWSNSELVFHRDHIFKHPEGVYAQVMQILNVLEFVWGLCFLKAAYSYLMGGVGAANGLNGQINFIRGLRTMLKFHWGSIVGGSFVNGVFFIPDLFYDLIKPSRGNPCHQTFYTVCCCCDRFLGFVRLESMPFIYMTGLPYCNAARISEKIYFHNTAKLRPQSSEAVGKYFRLGAHCMIATCGTFYCLFAMFDSGQISFQVALFTHVLNIFVVTYFVGIFTQMTEGIMIAELTAMYLNGQDEKIGVQMPASGNYQGSRTKGNLFRNSLAESNVKEGYQIVPT